MIAKHIKIEYVWIDGSTTPEGAPEYKLRSKTKVMMVDDPLKKIELEDIPMWSFDGSSTKQAEPDSSDCLLKPIKIYNDVFRSGNAIIVLCEVLNADHTPHETNKRVDLPEEDECWFGFEQEYTLLNKESRPLGFPEGGYAAPQGNYYCSIGHGNVTGRQMVEAHMDACIAAGIEITGINAEVMIGQWEFQVLGKGAKAASDDLWIARYLLIRITESAGVKVTFHPKLIIGDWNGSGLHANFSNKKMREIGGKEYFYEICDLLGERHAEHMEHYGADNHLRLTGQHETQHINEFSYGVSDRQASIRIPIKVVEDDWIGYLEDRRPASNANPYEITREIVNVLEMVKEPI